MRIVVQKFGGTSVATARGRQRVAERVDQAVREGRSPVLVVSAMGRRGDPYATDSLIELAREAHAELEPRDHDLMLTCGEIISAVIVGQTLRARGVAGVALTGAQAGIVTDSRFGEARVREVRPERLLALLRAEKVPVVAGFQGVTPDGEITTLGRGGSDTTAAVLGAALQADAVEIYSDVDGILTADPRKVTDSRLVREAGYQEVSELAHKGTKVIHPRAVEVAAQTGIPLWIKSTFRDGPGTRVHAIRSDRPVTGVTSQDGITFARLTLSGAEAHRRALKIFRRFADRGISVDFIDIRPHEMTFVVARTSAPTVRSLLGELGLDFQTHDGYVKVSVVGAGMTGMPGVMALVIEALTRESIEIHQATDSHTSISCLIDRETEPRALAALHGAFGLGQSSV